MKFVSAKDAKNSFGKLIDDALVEPVTIEKHGRPVVVVLSVDRFEKLRSREEEQAQDRHTEEVIRAASPQQNDKQS
ncbi:type II toxin-antitoxin system Phd/YefM family antitoxin [Roseibium album]|uniref:type II toxin-antitoxin system Phd/YefM family antitoxin n=1 Tax=Roseibium album TaxID=311410 RepID=UPI002493B867|nr:type II toxin-antitoxin system Phd/YefM family antitoxin [Roseibium album]